MVKYRSPGLPDIVDNSWKLAVKEISLVGDGHLPANQRKLLLVKCMKKTFDDGGKKSMPNYEEILKSLESVTFTSDEKAFLTKANISSELGESVTLALRILTKDKSKLPEGMFDNICKVMAEGMPKPIVKETVDPVSDAAFDYEKFISKIQGSELEEELKIGLRSLAKQSQTNATDLTKAKGELEKERTARIRAEILKELGDYGHVMFDKDNLTDLILHVRKSDTKEQTYENIFKELLKRHENIAADLFKEIGSDAGHNDSDAYKRLRKIADDLKTKDPTLSDDRAMEKACKLNPEIYKEYKLGNG